jgi:SWI/SNF-related matrix-associated actin-dependent regulator of chromatin subfamily A member 5
MDCITPKHTFDVVITSPETLERYIAKFKAVKWDYVILDEGHKIKNLNSNYAQNVRTLKCD